MKLIKCHINAFGKLENKDFDFSHGVNMFFGNNGIGKTTLTIFLKAMFYGMAKKGNSKAYAVERSKYMPWNGGVYGGSLTFEIDKNVYTIVRQFAQTPEGDSFQLIDEKTGLISNAYTKEIGLEIFGVGVETFEITAFLSQEGSLNNLNDEVRATLTGANKFENDLADCSQAQKLISAKITQEKSLCPKLIEIEEIKRAIRDAENLQEYNRQQLLSMQNQNQELQQNHQNLLVGQEQLKKEFNQSMKLKEKVGVLTRQVEEKRELLVKLQSDKIALLKESENQHNNTNDKNKKLILGCVSSSIVMALGIVGIILGVVLNIKTILLTLGVCLAVLSLMIFGITIIKHIGHNEKSTLQDKERITREIKLTQLNQSILTLEEQLKQEDQDLQNLKLDIKDVDYDKTMSLFYNIDKEKSLIDIKINQLKNEISANEEKLSQLRENLLNVSEKRIESLHKLELLEKTKSFMNLAKENVSKRYLQPMQEAFLNLYSLFKADEKLSLDINLNINQITAVGLKEREYLSQGLQDLLSICRRLALLDKVFDKEKPFIVLDDPFVNLDDDKLKVAKSIVAKYAENYQIIYICSHSRCKI